MFSLSKILVLAAIIALVWYGFKSANRASRIRAGQKIDEGSGDRPEIEDMAKCAVCDTFVPASGAANCGRETCPYPD